jgi:hypothetical protein
MGCWNLDDPPSTTKEQDKPTWSSRTGYPRAPSSAIFLNSFINGWNLVHSASMKNTWRIRYFFRNIHQRTALCCIESHSILTKNMLLRKECIAWIDVKCGVHRCLLSVTWIAFQVETYQCKPCKSTSSNKWIDQIIAHNSPVDTNILVRPIGFGRLLEERSRFRNVTLSLYWKGNTGLWIQDQVLEEAVLE